MNVKLVYIPLLVFIFSGFFAPNAAAQASTAGYKMKKIVLDAGHGGRDPGCTAAGYKEKDIVLTVALRVGQLINENLPDMEVIYTRKTDVFVDLLDRAKVANQAKADLFVSIHADAVASTSANGSSTYVMGSSQEETNLRVAMRENSVITYEENYETKYQGFDPKDPASYVIFALMQSAYFDQSIKLAMMIQKHYKQNTTLSTTRGVNQGGFVVLHHSSMPSILTEIGFLTNASDRKFITSKEGQEKIARSIFNAISEYKSTVEGNANIVTLKEGAIPNEPAPATPQAAGTTGNSARQSPSFVTETTASGVVFQVQVSASKTPVNRSRFGEYAGRIVEKKIGNYYKYFVGETKSYSEALSLQRQVRSKFSDAFIVAFENGEQVTITDGMKRN